MKRVIACGGRDFRDYAAVHRTLDKVYDACGGEMILIHGGQRTLDRETRQYHGADYLAHEWALARYVRIEVFPANWLKYQRRAGPIRNQEMADAGADIVVAFPGGAGTAGMVGIAGRASIPVARDTASLEAALATFGAL